MTTVLDWIGRQSRQTIMVVAVLLTCFIGYLDFSTSPAVSFSVFYVIPIGLGVWFVGFRAGVLLSVLSVALWMWGNIEAHMFVSPLVPFWNSAIRLSFYLVFAVVLQNLLELQRDLERRVVERTSAIAKAVAERMVLEKELLAISERERRRIGQDLHDSLCQHLTGTALAAQVLGEKLAVRNAPESAAADKVARLVEEGISMSRQLAAGLQPVDSSPDGLMQALQQFSETTSSLFNVNCRFECESPVLVRDTAVATHLYRIAQEAVSNAIKHGRANSVLVSLNTQEDGTALSILDDGVGLPPEPVRPKGLGLGIMAYRANVIGAVFNVQRGRTSGSVVTCTVPLSLQVSGASP
jgi:signal transduction histidine kinase